MKGLKTYFTYLSRNKLFTFVNVIGLSISLMFVLLIGNMVYRQLTVDKDIKDADRIYVFCAGNTAGGHYNLGPHLQSRYPEIDDWCALAGTMDFKYLQNGSFYTVSAMFVKENFFDFFGFPLLRGDSRQAMVSKEQAVITRSAAIRLFGTEDVIGKSLTEDGVHSIFTISGVVDDFDNSLIPSKVDVFIPFSRVKDFNYYASPEDTYMSNATSSALFFKMIPGADLNSKSDDVVNFLKGFFWFYKNGYEDKASFIKLHDFYFSDKELISELNHYSFQKVLIYIVVGILILLMAIFNYVSMSLAQTSYRAKEMATRRLLGSSRPDIFWRLIGESFVLTLIAMVLAFVLALAVEPFAMDLLEVKLNLSGNLTPLIVCCYVILLLVLSFLSGFVPATVLSNYNPMDVVKGTFRRKTKAIYLRLLNIFQSGLTIAMLGCTFYLTVQIVRTLNAPLGYSYGNVLCYTPACDKQKLLTFKNELKRLPFVKEVSFSQGLPIDGGNNNSMQIKVADSLVNMSFQTFTVDSAFLKIYGIRIIEDRHLDIDNRYPRLLDENTVKELESYGIKDYMEDPYGNKCFIAGKFNTFHIRSLFDTPHPLTMKIEPTDSIDPWDISVDFTDGDLLAYKKQTDDLYRSFVGGDFFEAKWYDDMKKDTYHNFIQLRKVLEVFTLAALIISLLGLTAMSIYFISQRKRDISIRKVFGSSSN
ncbi:FtsX-like permease family protein [uncultured Bacteroides sp.]|uniref:FtsX-like permease family protein n=1 Tax=uncultured Bacteroides sp. TaxID=162156 RepID=UPI00262F3529|nr:FtsX-like permease family protein [uncultured Bacteroides sp.]